MTKEELDQKYNPWHLTTEVQAKVNKFLDEADFVPMRIDGKNGKCRITYECDGAKLIYVVMEGPLVARYYKKDGFNVEAATWLDSLNIDEINKDVKRFMKKPKKFM